MYFLYSLLLGVILALSAPYWIVQMLRHGKYRAGFGERLGAVPDRLRAGEAHGCIWVHAVSVGEVLAVSKLAHELHLRAPHSRVFVSTTTQTGHRLAREKFGGENVFYFPLDFAVCIRLYLWALQPALVVLAETEFWPNFLRLSRGSGAKVAVVNARISDRSYSGYHRYRRLLRRVLMNVNLFLAQTDEDAQRLRAIGAEPSRVRVSGNLKFDVRVPGEVPLLSQLRRKLLQEGAGPVLVFGSTVEGEEQLLLETFKAAFAEYPGAMIIVAARHPERFDTVAGMLQANFANLVRRSQFAQQSVAGSIFLLDSIGELSSLYALANVAFVGGSLVPRGGHNILEPAQFGKPILVGPYTENFRDMVEIFRRAQALRVVDANSITQQALRLLANPGEARGLGRRAYETFESQSGATHRTADALMRLLREGRA